MEETNALEKYTLLQTDHRGNQLVGLNGVRAMLNLWALQNTDGKKVTYVADPAGDVVRVYMGQGKGAFSKILKTPEEIRAEFGDDLRIDESPSDERKCRVCGCTDSHACTGGCYWVERDLCSQCADKGKEKMV